MKKYKTTNIKIDLDVPSAMLRPIYSGMMNLQKEKDSLVFAKKVFCMFEAFEKLKDLSGDLIFYKLMEESKKLHDAYVAKNLKKKA